MFHSENFDRSKNDKMLSTKDEKAASVTLEQRFDPTGMFHWCPTQPFEDIIIVGTQSTLPSHILFLVDKYAPC